MEEKAASDFQEAPRTENRKNWFRGSFLRRFGFESVCLTDSGAVESRHSESERKFSGTFAGMISVVLILLFYAGWFAVIERENPKYLRDFRAAVNPDAVTYVSWGKIFGRKASIPGIRIRRTSRILNGRRFSRYLQVWRIGLAEYVPFCF